MDTAYLSLAIFLICIVLFVWNKIPMAYVAVGGCLVMVLFKVATFEQVFGQFAGSTIALVISVMIVSQAMTETGTTTLMSNFLKRISRNNSNLFLLFAVLLCALMSAFTSNLATALVFIPIVISYAESTGTNPRNYLIPIAMASQVGGACTLVGSAPQLVAQGLVQELVGQRFAFFDFAKVGVLLVFLLVVYTMTVGRVIGNGLWANRTEHLTAKTASGEAKADIDHKNVATVSIVFLLMTVMFYLEWITIELTAMIAAFICIFTGCLGGKPVRNCVSWGVVAKLAGCLGLIKALKVSGGTALVTNTIQQLFGNDMPVFALFIAFVALTTLFSEFLSNSTALMLTLPLAITFCEATGANAMSFAMGLVLASSVALSTPLSSNSLMLVMGDSYSFTDFVKYGILYDISAVILICIAVPVIFPL